jgi:hypothetical protein
LKSVTLSLDQAISPAFCTYDVSLVSAIGVTNGDKKSAAIWKLSDGSAWSDMKNVNTQFITFGVQQTLYDATLLDTFEITLRYSWSSSSSHDVTFNVQVVDACVTQVRPPAGPLFLAYTLMETQANLTISLTQSITLSYCTYDLAIQSGINDLWVWTDVVGSTLTDQPFGALQSAYDASKQAVYTVVLRYIWADNQTSSVTITVTITDPCAAEIQPPTGPLSLAYELLDST